jgi:glutathionyl-hydroquinone reductase
MKDILVEFTEYGAIIHKDSAKIESLKDLPHCFFNPDLSNVSGVSPSFWSLDESGTIVKASQEEIVRRNEYLTSKPAETPSLKTTLDGLKREILGEMETLHKKIASCIYDLQIADKQIIDTFDAKLLDVKNELDKNEKFSKRSEELLSLAILEQEKQIKHLKIGLGLSVLLTTILALI